MKSYIIISGGRVDLYSLQGIMDRHLESSRVIAVDKGIETCNRQQNEYKRRKSCGMTAC